MDKLINLVILMRPKHYVKNLFIFTPLFFVGNILQVDLLIKTIIVFCAFSFCASAIYILNDLVDVKEDRKHPKKKNRPIASGLINQKQAVLTIFFLLSLGLLLVSTVSLYALVAVIIYVIMNVAYCFKLKQIAVLDVVIIAMGFVIRLFVGSFATNTPLSIWIVIMTFLLALFMALGKRRDDVILYEKTGKKMRKVIDRYNLKLIDAAIKLMALVIVITYFLYTISTEVIDRINSDYLYLTTVFVIIGILRYLQAAIGEGKGGSPTHIALSDKIIQITLVLWVFSFGWILYK